VLWPGSNWTVLAVAGVCLAILAVLAPPLAGFTICFFLWKNLSWKAWIVGGIWMVVGIAFGAVKTRGFRGDLVTSSCRGRALARKKLRARGMGRRGSACARFRLHSVRHA